MKEFLFFFSIIIFLLLIPFLLSCTTSKPYIPRENIRAVKVMKGQTITIPFDGWVVPEWYLKRVILEEDRKNDNLE